MIEQFIKNLEHICDLVYFDGPWISLMKDVEDEPYLMYAIEPDNEWGKGWKWIVFKTCKNLIYQFLNKKITYDELRETRIESDILGKYGVKVTIGVEKYPVPIKLVYSNIETLFNTDTINDFQYFTEDMMKIGDLEKLENYIGNIDNIINKIKSLNSKSESQTLKFLELDEIKPYLHLIEDVAEYYDSIIIYFNSETSDYFVNVIIAESFEKSKYTCEDNNEIDWFNLKEIVNELSKI